MFPMQPENILPIGFILVILQAVEDEDIRGRMRLMRSKGIDWTNIITIKEKEGKRKMGE